MGCDEDCFRSLAERIVPILAKYSTSSSFPLNDLEVRDGRYEAEIRARYGAEEDYSVYIEETIKKKAKGKDDGRPDIIDQKITVYLPEDFWTNRGKEMAEELRSKFLTAKGSSLKVVVVTPTKGFRLEMMAK